MDRTELIITIKSFINEKGTDAFDHTDKFVWMNYADFDMEGFNDTAHILNLRTDKAIVLVYDPLLEDNDKFHLPYDKMTDKELTQVHNIITRWKPITE